MQSHDPTTLSYGLSDSPVALAAWLADKYRAWTDREPGLDDVLTQLSLYWYTNSARSSMRMYAEGLGSWDADSDWGGADAAQWGAPGPLQVPTALAVFPHDITVPPRAFAERFFNVRRYTVLPSGGHFGALEEPAALAEDIAAFLAALGE